MTCLQKTMSEEKEEMVRLVDGPANGTVKTPQGTKEIAVWHQGTLVAMYKRTTLSIVGKDTMLPVFKCVAR